MSYFTKRTGRVVAGSLAGALALSITPLVGLTGVAGAADALPPVADPIGAGNFCENGPTTEPFTDVSASDPSLDEITCLVGTGLTTGVTATTYEPNSSITRRQMALFIKRLVDKANELETGSLTDLPAYDGVPDYLDIAGESTAVKEAVGQLSQAGIVQGTTATTYSPAAPVSRRQMAAFINRAQDFLAGDPFSTTGDFFNDDNGDSGEDNLNALASVGIFQGDGAGNVNPGGDLTRRQMANILLRHAQVNFDAGAIDGAFQPATNQDFGITPTSSTVAAFDPVGGPGNLGAGAPVTVGVSGLDPARDYEVALVPCFDYDGPSVMANGANVLDPNGVSHTTGAITFSDQGTPPDDEADDIGNTPYGSAEILTIGFTSVNSTWESDVSPEADGTLSIRVGTFDYSDCVHVVVWDDNANDNDLDLGGVGTAVENDNAPTDKFAISGAITWSAGEAPNGYDMDECVMYLDKANDMWIDGEGYQINYNDTGDRYWYEGIEVDQEVTQAVFEDALSLGDCLDDSQAAYSRTNANFFNLYADYVADVPPAPTGTVGNFDAGVTNNDVKATWTETAPATADIDEYEVELVNAATGAHVAWASTNEVNTVGGGDSELTATFLNVADGTYVLRIHADSETDDGYFDFGPYSAPVAVGAPTDTVRPTITDARVTTDANLQDRFDTDDVVKLTFSEDMVDALDTNAQFVLTDGDGDTFTIDCATSTCALTDDGANVDRILTITLTAAVVDTNLGGNGVLNMPATINTTNAAVTDQAGNVVNLATSADVIVDKEA